MSIVTDDEIAAAYRWALAHANGCARGLPQEAGEVARDAATDGVMKAMEKARAGEAVDFAAYTRTVVRQRVKRALDQYRGRLVTRPGACALPDDLPARDLPAAGDVPLPDNVRDLPADLRDAVRLYYIDGYSLEECGHLLGLGATGVRDRLRRAAELLNPDGTAPDRDPHTKRLRNG